LVIVHPSYRFHPSPQCALSFEFVSYMSAMNPPFNRFCCICRRAETQLWICPINICLTHWSFSWTLLLLYANPGCSNEPVLSGTRWPMSMQTTCTSHQWIQILTSKLHSHVTTDTNMHRTSLESVIREKSKTHREQERTIKSKREQHI
jgi:hypothetical protein